MTEKKDLPIPELFSEPCGTYYMVKTENFGEQKAMYLEDENGNAAWYTSYISMLIVPVISWRHQL